MRVNEIINGITLDVDLNEKDRFCLFTSPSGAGKSFLFSMLDKYIKDKEFAVIFINGTLIRNANLDIKGVCLQDNVDYVILDDADLYLTQDIVDALSLTDKTVLISIHDLMHLHFDKFGIYKIKYENTSLVVRRKL